MRRFYSPLRYPGGKSCIFDFVSKLFYENDLIGISYAEPYAGGAGLALRLLFEGYVNQIYINDYDLAIFSFWKTVMDQPDEFCDWIKSVDVSIDNWHRYREIQRSKESATTFDLAQSTFFLNRTNVSGVIKGGVIGGLLQQGKYKIDARFKKEELITRIKNIGQLKDKIHVSNLDGIAFLKKIDKMKERAFVYLDPPYFQKGSELYMNFFNTQDHYKLSQEVQKLQSNWMISYDNHEFILNLYSSMRRVIYQLSQSTSNRTGDEVLIFPDKIITKESLGCLRSARFYNN